MSSYVRYFADQPIVLKAISHGLSGVDPQFKIDGGEILRGKELLGEIEICSSGSDLFAEDLAAKIGELSRVGSPAAAQVVARVRTTKSIVAVRIIDGERDPAMTWELITPLWSVLPALSTGLTQVDGQGFYDQSQLIVALA